MEDFYGTNYPYLDYKGGVVGSVLGPIRRLVAPINPFASQQISSKESIGMGDRWGNGWWQAPRYVAGRTIAGMWPNHFDADTAKDPNHAGAGHRDGLIGDRLSPAVNGRLGFSEEKLPRACERARSHYNRCKMVNGREKCADEGNWVMGVCPNWALAELANLKNFEKKVLLVQKAEYNYAMSEAPYNAGRSVGDISNKTHVHGTRQYLRPDTMWADERYRHVTRDEIKAAKQRHEDRLKADGRWDPELHPDPHMYDNTGAQQKVAKPLY